MIRILAFFIISNVLMTDAICADNKAAVAFSRSNAERFTSEIRELKGLAWGSKIIVTGTIPKFEFLTNLKATYDYENSEMVLRKYSYMRPLTFFESCRNSGGSSKWQNAFGTKTVVRPRTCESFRIIGDQNIELVGKHSNSKRIRMSPSQFRSIMKNGIQAKIDFTIGNPREIFVVEFEERVVKTTIDNPIQTHWKYWTLNGQESSIKWLLPGEKIPVEVWNRLTAIR